MKDALRISVWLMTGNFYVCSPRRQGQLPPSFSTFTVYQHLSLYLLWESNDTSICQSWESYVNAVSPISRWKNWFGKGESEVLGVWFCISSSNCSSREPSGNSPEPLPRRAASARSSGSSVCSVASLRAQEGGEQTPRPPALGIRRRSALACSAETSLPVSATGKKKDFCEWGFDFLVLAYKWHY